MRCVGLVRRRASLHGDRVGRFPRAIGWGLERLQDGRSPQHPSSCMHRCELNIVVGAVAGSLFKMAGFTRPVVWRFCAALLLLSDMLAHLVRAATLEENSDYQACVANPSTCFTLCVFLPLPRRAS